MAIIIIVIIIIRMFTATLLLFTVSLSPITVVMTTPTIFGVRNVSGYVIGQSGRMTSDEEGRKTIMDDRIKPSSSSAIIFLNSSITSLRTRVTVPYSSSSSSSQPTSLSASSQSSSLSTLFSKLVFTNQLLPSTASSSSNKHEITNNINELNASFEVRKIRNAKHLVSSSSSSSSSSCFLKGGFNVRFTCLSCKSDQKDCQLKSLMDEVRIESGCMFDGHRLHLKYRNPLCVPKEMVATTTGSTRDQYDDDHDPTPPLVTKTLKCLMTWSESFHAYTVIQLKGDDHYWLMRLPVRFSKLENSFSGYISRINTTDADYFLSLPAKKRNASISDWTSYLTSSSSSLAHYLFRAVRDFPRPITSLCVDESDFCMIINEPHEYANDDDDVKYANYSIDHRDDKKKNESEVIYESSHSYKQQLPTTPQPSNRNKRAHSLPPSCTPGRLYQITCPRTCSLCTGQRPRSCILPHNWSGVWIDLTNGEEVVIQADLIKIKGIEFHCIDWSSIRTTRLHKKRKRDRDDDDDEDDEDDDDDDDEDISSDHGKSPGIDSSPREVMLTVGYDDGCHARYACATIQRTSASVLLLKITEPVTWPFLRDFEARSVSERFRIFHPLGDGINCRLFHYSDDDEDNGYDRDLNNNNNKNNDDDHYGKNGLFSKYFSYFYKIRHLTIGGSLWQSDASSSSSSSQHLKHGVLDLTNASETCRLMNVIKNAAIISIGPGSDDGNDDDIINNNNHQLSNDYQDHHLNNNNPRHHQQHCRLQSLMKINGNTSILFSFHGNPMCSPVIGSPSTARSDSFLMRSSARCLYSDPIDDLNHHQHHKATSSSPSPSSLFLSYLSIVVFDDDDVRQNDESSLLTSGMACLLIPKKKNDNKFQIKRSEIAPSAILFVMLDAMFCNESTRRYLDRSLGFSFASRSNVFPRPKFPFLLFLDDDLLSNRFWSLLTHDEVGDDLRTKHFSIGQNELKTQRPDSWIPRDSRVYKSDTDRIWRYINRASNAGSRVISHCDVGEAVTMTSVVMVIGREFFNEFV